MSDDELFAEVARRLSDPDFISGLGVLMGDSNPILAEAARRLSDPNADLSDYTKLTGCFVAELKTLREEKEWWDDITDVLHAWYEAECATRITMTRDAPEEEWGPVCDKANEKCIDLIKTLEKWGWVSEAEIAWLEDERGRELIEGKASPKCE